VVEWILPRKFTDLNFPWQVSTAYLAQYDAAVDMLVGGLLKGYLTLGNCRGLNQRLDVGGVQ